MKRSFRAAAAALALLGFVPAQSKSATEPYEINAILSMTGPGSFLGKNESASFAEIEKIANKKGGVAGRPIKFVIQDDQSNPQVALQLTNALIAKQVPLILGPSLSGACGAVAPLVKDGPVVYCFSAGMRPPADGYMFAIGPSTGDIIAVNIRYFREKGYRKVALLTTTDASGQDGERGFDEALALPENRGLSVVAREHYGVADLSVSAQIARIKEAGAQAMMAWGTGAPIGTVFHAINDSGLDIPVGISGGNMIFGIMKQFETFLPRGMVSAAPPCVVPDALPKGAMRDAVRQYVDTFAATGVHADVAQAISWDPAWLVIAALNKLGPAATAGQIRSFINNTRGWSGVSGTYDFRNGANPRGLSGTGSILVVRWDTPKQNWVAVSKFGGAP
jgi:branched-chain amino acid transport system substrate-binding protein